MMHSNCRAVKPLSFFTLIVLLLVVPIIRRSINCHIYVLSNLLNVGSLFCLSMFCRIPFLFAQTIKFSIAAAK